MTYVRKKWTRLCGSDLYRDVRRLSIEESALYLQMLSYALAYRQTTIPTHEPIIGFDGSPYIDINRDKYPTIAASLEKRLLITRQGDRWVMSALQAMLAPKRSPISRAVRELVLTKHGKRCFYCRRRGRLLEIDHLVPISRGGVDHHDNMVPSCRSCNASKLDKLYHEWADAPDYEEGAA